ISGKELQEMSTEGSKYVNKEIKNALKEVLQIKLVMEQGREQSSVMNVMPFPLLEPLNFHDVFQPFY
uniref:Clusterin (Fragments) n=1 Tax=Ovis aries TaxID=9940 RepID=CLUS_SHEEP|nr:RecName: Full=Clusterin; AltName: Full=Sulfated glycoprotein 2; Short=SGP-2; Contains: RecName: Full=Clusterin beta chain; Contains: RecName: Full=Clusterin alpha chain [Ovis aries]